MLQRVRDGDRRIALVDELAKSKCPRETWNNLEIGLCPGPDPYASPFWKTLKLEAFCIRVGQRGCVRSFGWRLDAFSESREGIHLLDEVLVTARKENSKTN